MPYDERAIAHVHRLRRAVPRRSRFDEVAVELGALFNALEVHLENGGDVAVVEGYHRIFVAVATLRDIDPAHTEKATAIFEKLTKYLRHAAADPRR